MKVERRVSGWGIWGTVFTSDFRFQKLLSRLPGCTVFLFWNDVCDHLCDYLTLLLYKNTPIRSPLLFFAISLTLFSHCCLLPVDPTDELFTRSSVTQLVYNLAGSFKS